MIEILRTAFEDSAQRTPGAPISSMALACRSFTNAGAGANAAMASIALACLSLTGGGANAQVDSVPAISVPEPIVLDPVVITATRRAERSFDVAVGVDRIDAATIQTGQPMVNISETLSRIPGLVSLNRQNYAQDLQISSRGFGARAAFGVRGVRLYQDEIPATMPDGQGQTGSFSLLSAESIEILRGPFSTQYGNAAGGVISITTEDGKLPPSMTLNAVGGSYGTVVAGAKANGRVGGVGYVVAASRLDTDGYRDHSSARRDLLNAKVTAGSDRTRITMIGSVQDQPGTEDPLGLTRAQWESNPRQVDPVAIQFDTRKTIRQQQGGLNVEHKLSSDASLYVTGYAGHRSVRQNLALSGIAETSSGGIVDLDRAFGGLGVRLTMSTRLAGQPLTITAGGDFDRLRENRRGFVNNNGAPGVLRRDEIDEVSGNGAWARIEWQPIDAVSLSAGSRHSDVRFKSDDHFITTLNGDDSGRRNFNRASPTAGAVWHATPDLNVYASYGEGFETPTFAEMAYRNPGNPGNPASSGNPGSGGTGLNFSLQPATSRALEIGAKWIYGKRHRLNVAAFAVRGRDEIVTDTASGGRTTFRNAGQTRRDGFEALWESRWPLGLSTHFAYTYLKAYFADEFRSGTPPVTVAAGSRLPGVPESSAYAELAWKPGTDGFLPGFQAALEVTYVDRIFINDRNSDAAPRYTVANLWAGLEQPWAGWSLRQFVRVNNIADRKYVGSVIVGDANGRSFESAPGRNWSVGVSALARF